jgi:hypothetical protein
MIGAKAQPTNILMPVLQKRNNFAIQVTHALRARDCRISGSLQIFSI